jgi:hypothetical protein
MFKPFEAGKASFPIDAANRVQEHLLITVLLCCAALRCAALTSHGWGTVCPDSN